MIDDPKPKDVMVIGAGMAGIEASLLLAQAGREVHLVEECPYIGGTVIRFEDIYPNMDCATCMVAPKQQDLLQNEHIHLHTLSTVEKVSGSNGDFKVRVLQRARYINDVACIGCGMCYEPCPVSLDNEFEEGMAQRKAIYVACAGALPNVPRIDTDNCLRFKGKGEDCQLCAESCMFEAIELDAKDEVLDLEVSSILVATGYELMDPSPLKDYGYGTVPDVYTAVEFERLYASNGPTEGELKLKNGKVPGSVAIVHCVGREEQGYCSAVCCLYSLKFAHYVKHKLPEATITALHTDMCVPGKTHQRFQVKMVEGGADLVRATDVKVKGGKGGITIGFANAAGKASELKVDMVVLAPAFVPRSGTGDLAGKLGIDLDDAGFLAIGEGADGPVRSSREGIFLAGCATGPKDISRVVTEADSAVAMMLGSHRGVS